MGIRLLRTIVVLTLLALISGTAYAQTDWSRRRLDSSTQDAINALSGTAVQNLPIPVLLGVEVSDLTRNFGDPRSGDRTHEGLDMLAPQGTPIASPTDAVVLRTGNGSSSGLYVRTANPDDETFVYMHLSAFANGIEQGSVLERGDIIGYVGNTGNASGGPAHLHFEIRRGGATDPFPRLTETFTLAERMAGTAEALQKSSQSLAGTYAKNFDSIFKDAISQGVTVPDAILAALNGASPEQDSSGTTHLSIGDTGNNVVTLQQFLIDRGTGPAAKRLAGATATGYFGPITQAALIEYQESAHITQTGFVDDQTYYFIFASALEGDSVTDDPDAIDTTNTLQFYRDLTLGFVGEDVRALQELLNAKGFILSDTGAGAPGFETTYFGERTKSALARFQAANNINPPAGYFGPITRGFLERSGIAI